MAQILAQLEDAKWKLSETTYYAPADGYVINLQLRPGSTVSQLPVHAGHELRRDRSTSSSRSSVRTSCTRCSRETRRRSRCRHIPGRIIKAKVDSIIWAQGQGQLPLTGTLPQTGAVPPPEGRFAVKLVVGDRDKDMFLAAGARGKGAIYTHRFMPIHIIRKVLLRVSSYLNWVIIKHHISLH